MRMINFAKRNFKELIRDPFSLLFEIALPLFLLFIFQQFDLPADNFRLENFTPSIILFGFSFITLFTASLIAKDRTSSLLIRLGTSPMKPKDYILGYILALIPLVLIQIVLFFVLAIALGLSFTISIIPTVLVALVIAIFFISMGILVGSLVSEKGTGALGSGIVQLVCFTSVFEVICTILPFEGCLNILKGVLHNDFSNITPAQIVVFAIYFIAVILLSIVVFKKKMVSDNK